MGLRRWFRQKDPMVIDLIEKMLMYNPNKRITARGILEHPYLKQAGRLSWEETQMQSNYNVGRMSQYISSHNDLDTLDFEMGKMSLGPPIKRERDKLRNRSEYVATRDGKIAFKERRSGSMYETIDPVNFMRRDSIYYDTLKTSTSFRGNQSNLRESDVRKEERNSKRFLKSERDKDNHLYSKPHPRKMNFNMRKDRTKIDQNRYESKEIMKMKESISNNEKDVRRNRIKTKEGNNY